MRESWKTDGPGLPIEFARESGDGRMTTYKNKKIEPLTEFIAELEEKRITEFLERD